jgi:hypothetical protein
VQFITAQVGDSHHLDSLEGELRALPLPALRARAISEGWHDDESGVSDP